MSKVKRIDALTPEQTARFDEWSDKWIDVGLRTAPADRARFESAAKKCYEYANIPWHGNVVWVSSPLVMAFAAPTAALLIEVIRKKNRGAVGGAVRGAVGDAVRGAVDDAESIKKAVLSCIQQGWSNYIGGQFWVGGWGWGPAYTSFFRDVGNLELSGELWRRGMAYEETVQSACWWYPHKDFLMVCERPRQIHREIVDPARPRGWGSHRMHNDKGAAISWGDGWGLWMIHGVRVTRQIVEAPETLSIDQIDNETNSEVRRVMIDRFGPKRYLEESRAAVIQELPENHYLIGLRSARLLRKEVPDDEPILMIDLLNSTPEPDGTTKRYLLRCDPSAYDGLASTNAHAAAASTWRYPDGSLAFKDYRDYVPEFES